MSNNLLKDKKITHQEMIHNILSYLKKEWKSFLLAGILIIINVVCDIIIPLLTGYFTDNIKSDHIALTVIFGLAFGALAITLVSQGFLYLENVILTKAGQKIIYELRMDVFRHVESMSQNQFNDMPVGSLVTRVCNYTSNMSEFFTNTLVNIIRQILTIFGVYIIMLTLSWKLSLVLLTLILFTFVISYIFSRYVHKAFGEERNTLSELNTFLNESLSGMKITQLFNQETKSLKKFIAKNEKYRRIRYKLTVAFAIYRPLVSLIYVLSIALILYLGFSWNLNVGEVVSFYFYISKLFNPIQDLADELNQVQRFVTNSERLFNLLDIQPEVLDAPEAREIDHFEGKIEFRHVYFAYEKDNWILKDVSFTIPARTTAAFVGATGAGKSTILSLIVRNYEINSGQILIDDQDIRTIQIASLRKAVGQMLQDVFLFSGTIRENITLFDDHFSDEDIRKACDYVSLTPMISGYRKGLEEPVIEKGENLSAGQRQLLSFARTIIHQPQIMILDEATANIDTDTEVAIQSSLEKMKSIGTMLVVAHRLSTIQHADQIIVLQHGEIIEKGTHTELLKKKGYYYHLYELQFEKK